ncbi:hypothetical protein [Ornithinimicrobium kibberense]|uniref:hypothetical protein n=1 Tax=Ornithinimicrobium kibberense TaxID=282060 RepID=UPI00360DE1B6
MRARNSSTVPGGGCRAKTPTWTTTRRTDPRAAKAPVSSTPRQGLTAYPGGGPSCCGRHQPCGTTTARAESSPSCSLR